jgi:hypothetical protein
MVSELHRMGYQRLRIMPYLHPLAWRLLVGPCESFSSRNGLALADGAWDTVAGHSSAGGGNCYFDWRDAKGDNARELAEKFVLRFPDVSKRGLGRDWEYSGWLSELLGVLEGGDLLPVMEWEFMRGKPEELDFLPIWSMTGENTCNDGSSGYVLALLPSIRKFPLPPNWR